MSALGRARLTFRCWLLPVLKVFFLVRWRLLVTKLLYQSVIQLSNVLVEILKATPLLTILLVTLLLALWRTVTVLSYSSLCEVQSWGQCKVVLESYIVPLGAIIRTLFSKNHIIPIGSHVTSFLWNKLRWGNDLIIPRLNNLSLWTLYLLGEHWRFSKCSPTIKVFILIPTSKSLHSPSRFSVPNANLSKNFSRSPGKAFYIDINWLYCK